MQFGDEVEVRKGKLKLSHLAADVQALRDVKHFVKDYQGHLAPAMLDSGICSTQSIRIQSHTQIIASSLWPVTQTLCMRQPRSHPANVPHVKAIWMRCHDIQV